MQVGGARVAVAGILGEAAFDNPPQRQRRTLAKPSKRWRVFVDDGIERRFGRGDAGKPGDQSASRTRSDRRRTDRTGSRCRPRVPARDSCMARSPHAAPCPSSSRGRRDRSRAGRSAEAATRARPKSTILMRPARVTMTFSGLRSRCTMPASCAAARPSAICVARSSSRFSGMAPCAARPASGGRR